MSYIVVKGGTRPVPLAAEVQYFELPLNESAIEIPFVEWAYMGYDLRLYLEILLDWQNIPGTALPTQVIPGVFNKHRIGEIVLANADYVVDERRMSYLKQRIVVEGPVIHNSNTTRSRVQGFAVTHQSLPSFSFNRQEVKFCSGGKDIEVGAPGATTAAISLTNRILPRAFNMFTPPQALVLVELDRWRRKDQPVPNIKWVLPYVESGLPENIGMTLEAGYTGTISWNIGFWRCTQNLSGEAAINIFGAPIEAQSEPARAIPCCLEDPNCVPILPPAPCGGRTPWTGGGKTAKYDANGCITNAT